MSPGHFASLAMGLAVMPLGAAPTGAVQDEKLTNLDDLTALGM